MYDTQNELINNSNSNIHIDNICDTIIRDNDTNTRLIRMLVSNIINSKETDIDNKNIDVKNIDIKNIDIKNEDVINKV